MSDQIKGWELLESVMRVLLDHGVTLEVTETGNTIFTCYQKKGRIFVKGGDKEIWQEIMMRKDK